MNINFCRSNTNALKSWSETNQCAILHSPEREARRRKTELIKQLIREMTVARLYGIKQTLPPSEAARKINYLTRCVSIRKSINLTFLFGANFPTSHTRNKRIKCLRCVS